MLKVIDGEIQENKLQFDLILNHPSLCPVSNMVIHLALAWVSPKVKRIWVALLFYH